MNKSRLDAARPLLLALGLLTTGVSVAAVPTQMRAVVSDGSSGPEGLKVESVPVAQPGAGQVLIKVYAASVNPVDWKRYARPAAAGAPAPKVDPLIPGRDIAGVVARLGPGVTRFKVGDRIFGEVAALPGGPMNGAYAQYAVAQVTDIAPKPQRFTFAQASGLGIATVTGVRTVFNAKVHAGQRVLVTGAAGGVGSAAVQAAKARGAYVVGTAAARHTAYLKGIGADEHVDYGPGDWATRIHDIDVVIDTVSAANATLALQTMKKGGTLEFVAGGPKAAACMEAGVDCQGGALGTMNVAPAGAPAGTIPADNPVVDEILRLASAGKLTVTVDASYPMEQAGAAQVANRNGGTEGKIVVAVDPANAKRK